MARSPSPSRPALFTVGPLTGGQFILGNLNPVNCHYIANFQNAKGTITEAMGIFATVTGSVQGRCLRPPAPLVATVVGLAVLDVPDILNTAQATAVGHINLHSLV